MLTQCLGCRRSAPQSARRPASCGCRRCPRCTTPGAWPASQRPWGPAGERGGRACRGSVARQRCRCAQASQFIHSQPPLLITKGASRWAVWFDGPRGWAGWAEGGERRDQRIRGRRAWSAGGKGADGQTGCGCCAVGMGPTHSSPASIAPQARLPTLGQPPHLPNHRSLVAVHAYRCFLDAATGKALGAALRGNGCLAELALGGDPK